MRTARRGFVLLAALALIVGVTQAVAFQDPERPQEPQRMQGELLRVDTEARTLAIRTADDKEQQFRYTDQTDVTGEKESIAGLATEAGVMVTVTYEEDETKQPVATKIEVHPRQ